MHTRSPMYLRCTSEKKSMFFFFRHRILFQKVPLHTPHSTRGYEVAGGGVERGTFCVLRMSQVCMTLAAPCTHADVRRTKSTPGMFFFFATGSCFKKYLSTLHTRLRGCWCWVGWSVEPSAFLAHTCMILATPCTLPHSSSRTLSNRALLFPELLFKPTRANTAPSWKIHFSVPLHPDLV